MNLQDPNYLNGLIVEDLKLQLADFAECSKSRKKTVVKIYYNNQSIVINGKSSWGSVGAAKLAIRRFFDYSYYVGKLYKICYSNKDANYNLTEITSNKTELIDCNKSSDINSKRIEELYKLLEFRVISD